MNPDEMIGLNVKRSGSITMPVAYATWLDDAELVDEFDSWWAERRTAGVHGDAFTPFAERHLAPLTVEERGRRARRRTGRRSLRPV